MGGDTKSEEISKATADAQTNWIENVQLALDHPQAHITLLSDNFIHMDSHGFTW